MSTVVSMLYRVILWIGVCTGAVFCCGNLANRSFAKKNDKMHVGEQHICAHCDFDVCALSAICEFITAKKRKCDIGEKKWCDGVNVENYMMVHGL